MKRDNTKLKERQQSILDAIVREYVRTARPVASRDLVRARNLGVESATIRNEMRELDERGFLEQPYTSSGRVPTDRGYRYFVDHLLTDVILADDEARSLRNAFAIRHADEFIQEFARRVSKIAGAFAAAGMESEHRFSASGFSTMLEEPEFADPEYARAFGRLTDFLDIEIRRVLPRAREEGRMWEGKMWIGAENPWRPARSYTMTIVPWEHPWGFKGFVSIISPRRANYPKQKAIINLIRMAYDA